jgi:A/G-specific adenine glycosylase
VPPAPAELAAAVVAHYARARRDLPWRRTRDPYAIWVSEIMLQQTRVATVIPYWERWLGRFPTVRALAEAPLDDVLAHWAGLGYYTRARNLHRGAREVVERWGGALPDSAGDLRAVPGIGAYTAGAIASIAYGERAPLVDGNVARVLARVFGVDDDVKSAAGGKRIWALAAALMDGLAGGADPGDLNQGLMELGATVCAPRGPSCLACPLAAACVARRDGRQDALPVLPARRGLDELPVVERVALWIEADGAVLLARRRPEGLYGGLWELPQGDDLAAARRLVGARVTVGAAAFSHEQVLSHRRIRVEVRPARLAGKARLVGPRDPGYDALSWHPVAGVLGGDVGASSLTRALLDRKSPWSSNPTRSPSSRRATRRSSKASPPSATTSPTTTSRRRRAAPPRPSTSSSTTTTRSRTRSTRSSPARSRRSTRRW